jgi:hypothetical protein
VADTHDGRIAQFDDMNADAWMAYGGCCIGTGQFNLPMGVFVLPLATPSPDPVMSTTGLKYSDTVVGTASASQTVTLSNIGTSPLTIASIAPSGDFTQTNNCPGSLAGGQSCTVNVVFAPAATGLLTGSVVFSFAAGAPKTVRLSGTGALVAISPTAINFGNVNAGGRPATATVTVSNPGASAAGVTPSLKGSPVYRLTNGCSATLAAGASCTLTVKFSPQSSAYYTATLTVTDAAGIAQTVSITGTGVSN